VGSPWEQDETLAEFARKIGVVSTNRFATPLTLIMWATLQRDPRFEAIKNDPKNNAPLLCAVVPDWLD